jgi:hypothetical protein
MGKEMFQRDIKIGLRLLAPFCLVASLYGVSPARAENQVSVDILPGPLTADLLTENGEIALRVDDARGSGAGWRVAINGNCPIEPLGPPKAIVGLAIDSDHGPKYSGGSFTADPDYGTGVYEQKFNVQPDNCGLTVTTVFAPSLRR